MKLRKLGWLLLKLTVVLGLLWILSLHKPSEIDWLLSYSSLDYTDDDGSPEKMYNCSAILQGEKEAVQQAKLLAITRDFYKSVKIPDEYYIKATQNCKKFKLSRKYITFPLSLEEENFPLAYSMVVHHKVQNFERLLRAIYAPQNIYCVHIDKDSKDSVFSAVSAIVSCFPNVFMVSQAVNVVYAAWSRVQADLNCMADLNNSTTKWKYFINLCGQDFPLKTNLEIVRALRSLNGRNSLVSQQMPEDKKWRVLRAHQIVNEEIKWTGKMKGKAPFNLPILSGGAYIVVSRGYIRSVLKDKRIHALIEWAKDTYSPDEMLWATIQRIPGVPGSVWPNPKYDMNDLITISRMVKWQGLEGLAYPACAGEHVRGVCVFGAGDLQWILSQHHLFANKFDADTDPISISCLEKYLRHKTLIDSLYTSLY